MEAPAQRLARSGHRGLEHRRRHLQRTYGFSRSYTPAASGYHTLANNFFGTLYMAG